MGTVQEFFLVFILGASSALRSERHSRQSRVIDASKKQTALVLRLGLKRGVSEKCESIPFVVLLFLSFKLLKFITVSFHLALTLFVLKQIVSIYFCSYIYLYDLNTRWFKKTKTRQKQKFLELIQSDVVVAVVVVVKKPKMLLPRRSFFFVSFADSFIFFFNFCPSHVWNRCQN